MIIRLVVSEHHLLLRYSLYRQECVVTDTLSLVLGYRCSLGADDEFTASHHDGQRTHGSHAPHGYTNTCKTGQSKIRKTGQSKI